MNIFYLNFFKYGNTYFNGNRFVHGTCDPEADLTTYHQRKESQPDYEYVCLACKNITQQGRLHAKRNSKSITIVSYKISY